MSKLNPVVCGLFSYQKKAPKQVWKDCRQEFGDYLWRVLTEEIPGETKWEHTIKQYFTSESEVLTALERGTITPYSKHKGFF